MSIFSICQCVNSILDTDGHMVIKFEDFIPYCTNLASSWIDCNELAVKFSISRIYENTWMLHV